MDSENSHNLRVSDCCEKTVFAVYQDYWWMSYVAPCQRDHVVMSPCGQVRHLQELYYCVKLETQTHSLWMFIAEKLINEIRNSNWRFYLFYMLETIISFFLLWAAASCFLTQGRPALYHESHDNLFSSITNRLLNFYFNRKLPTRLKFWLCECPTQFLAIVVI